MRNGISLTALTTALLISSLPAQAQVSLGVGGGGVSVNAGLGGSSGINAGASIGGSDSGGLGVNAGASVGGSNGLGVDANANVGGNSGVDAGASLSLGSSSSTGAQTGPNGGPLIDIGSPAQGRLVDVGTANGGLQVDVLRDPLPSSPPSQPSHPLAGGVHLSALNETARVDALIGLIDTPDLANIDIDAAVNDRLVSITPVTDLLDSADLARVTASVGLGGPGRTQLLDAIAGSAELTSILNHAGIAPSDVLALQIDSAGRADLIVLGGAAQLVADIGDTPLPTGTTTGTGTGPLAGLTDLQLADLDVDLLSDQQLAAIDLTLLPNEAQRLETVVRLLDSNPPTPESQGSAGPVTIVRLDTLLGDESLADVEATLGHATGQPAELNLSANVLGALDDAGVDPDAVVGVAVGANGRTQVLTDLNLGDTQVADIAIGTAGTSASGNGGNNGSGSAGTGAGGTPVAGSGTGGSGSGNTTGGDTGDGPTTTNDAGGSDAGNVGGTVIADAREPVPPTAAVADNGLFASLDCGAGITALTTGTAPTPVAVRMASKLELVRLTDCTPATTTGDAPMLGATLNANPALAATLQSARVTPDEVVGATVQAGVVTVFVRQDNA